MSNSFLVCLDFDRKKNKPAMCPTTEEETTEVDLKPFLLYIQFIHLYIAKQLYFVFSIFFINTCVTMAVEFGCFSYSRNVKKATKKVFITATGSYSKER